MRSYNSMSNNKTYEPIGSCYGLSNNGIYNAGSIAMTIAWTIKRLQRIDAGPYGQVCMIASQSIVYHPASQ